MSEIIANLRNDHRNLTKLLQLLSAETGKLEKGEYTDYQIIADIMQYFVNYPDIYHHPHEDLILNTLKNRNSQVTGPCTDIFSEHQEMASKGAEILDEIKQIQGNAIFSRENFVRQLKEYIACYHAHMEKEEEALFKIAEKYLNVDDWKKINLTIRMAEDPLFGRILDAEYNDLFKAIMAEAVEN
jgi:hemerythrin-like domain-containing protein